MINNELFHQKSFRKFKEIILLFFVDHNQNVFIVSF